MGNTELIKSLTNIRNIMYRKITLDIPNLKHKFTIDTMGIVRNETNGKTLKGTSITKKNRYVKIHLDKFYALHRQVALHFIPNPDNLPEVNHKDGNRYNNAVSNLEWSTSSNNVKHAYATGLKSNHGMKNPFRKLTEAEVIKIWYAPKEWTARQVVTKLGLPVGLAAVKSIRQGKNWSSVTSKLK